MNLKWALLRLFVLGVFTQGMQAQLRAKLVAGDFAPLDTKKTPDEKNTKHKDAPHSVYDENRNFWHASWTQFDRYKSKKKEDQSVIYYARSEEGKTWTEPKQINCVSGNCLDGDSTVKGPMPCVGPNGEVYIAWAALKGLAFQRSLDSGRTWLKEEQMINPIRGGWSNKVDGIKTNGLPHAACDVGYSAFRGRVYICWSDEKNGATNKDVFLIYSDDKGDHWTEPILVTYRPNHKEQFKPILKVDPVTGYVYLMYFDKQNFTDGKETDIYLAISKNGGLKFDTYKVNERPFLFNANFMELRLDSAVKVRWLQPDEKNRFCLYEVALSEEALNDCLLREAAEEMDVERTLNWADNMDLNFTLKKNSTLTAVITKPLLPGFEQPVIKNKRLQAGNNTLRIDTKALKLKKGNYVITLYYQNRNTYVWISAE